LFPNWLCYKLTQNAPNLTYSDLGFKKFSWGKTPRPPLLRGLLCGGRGGGEGEERGGEATWRDPESGLPRGPLWLSTGVTIDNYY